MADVLQYAAEMAIESFLPVVLELLASLLEADRKALSSKKPGARVVLLKLWHSPHPPFISCGHRSNEVWLVLL